MTKSRNLSEMTLVQGPLPDAAIEEIVHELKAIGRAATLELALRVGKIVYERIFDRDTRRLREVGRGDRSFRAVASHPSVPFSAASLWRAVGLHRLSLKFPDILKREELGVSHLRAVLGLNSVQQQRLLEQAASERWSKGRLEEEVMRVREKGAHRTGRPPLAPPVRYLKRLAQALDGTNDEALCRADQCHWTPQSAEGALKVIRATLQTCHRLAQNIERGLASPPPRGLPARAANASRHTVVKTHHHSCKSA